MGNNAFRFEANEGFPMQMLMNTGLYLDQNVSTRFWNGQGKNETDGVWGELMKFMKSIPDLAQKSADRNKESHAVNKYALQLYRSIRDGHSNQGGAKGFLKTWEKDADKCPHWSISARAYGLIGDASEPTETNIISWIQSKTEEINGGGGEKTREIGNKAALKTAQIFESSRPKSHAQHVEIPDSPGRNPEHQDSDNLALPS